LPDLEPYEEEAVVLPAKAWRNYFLLPLSMGGEQDRTMWFLFDTGANVSLVDPDSLSEVSDWHGGAGQSANLIDVHCGELVFKKLPVRTFELDAIERALGCKLDGILGYPAFRQLLLTLDYGAMEMRIANGALPRPDGQSIFRARKIGNHRPWVEMELAGETHTVLIDSGSGGRISLKGVDADDWAIEPVAVGTSMGVDGLESRRLGRVAGSAPNGALVHMLTPGSPAEQAGIQVGDLIVEISGSDFDDIPARGAEPLQDGDRSYHRFRLIRDGVELEIEVDLVELVPLRLRD
jgi:hypothetical protein